MSAFNDINGVPASGNHFTLTKILRDEWNFDGFVVSDYTSVQEMIAHGYAADGADAARLGTLVGRRDGDGQPPLQPARVGAHTSGQAPHVRR